MEIKDIYIENGYKDRNDYLRKLADDYGVDSFTMECLSTVLGNEEDFDGLITALEDLHLF